MSAARTLGDWMTRRHDRVDLRKSLDLTPAQGRIAQHLAQRLGEFFGRAVLLQEFRHHLHANDEIGQDDGRAP